MANTDSPRGLWPIRHLSGGCPQRANEYPIAAAYTTKIHTGALVKLVAGGGIEVAAAGNRLLGVFAGVQYTDSGGNPVFKKFWDGVSGSSNIKAMVYDDPSLVFGVQAAGTVNAADRGQLGDHLATAGDDLTGQSNHELGTTLGTAAAGLRVLGKIDRPDNDWGLNVDLEVMIHEHEFSRDDPGTPGV